MATKTIVIAEGKSDEDAGQPVFSAGPVPQFSREAAHGQDERHEDDAFDQHLGQGEVRGALQREHQGDPVPGDGHHQHREEAFVGAHGGQRADNDPGSGDQLQGRVGVDEIDAVRQRLAGEDQDRQREDERHRQDDGKVEEQRTALGPSGDPDRDVVQRPDGQLVGAVAVDPGREPGPAPGTPRRGRSTWPDPGQR